MRMPVDAEGQQRSNLSDLFDMAERIPKARIGLRAAAELSVVRSEQLPDAPRRGA